MAAVIRQTLVPMARQLITEYHQGTALLGQIEGIRYCLRHSPYTERPPAALLLIPPTPLVPPWSRAPSASQEAGMLKAVQTILKQLDVVPTRTQIVIYLEADPGDVPMCMVAVPTQTGLIRREYRYWLGRISVAQY